MNKELIKHFDKFVGCIVRPKLICPTEVEDKDNVLFTATNNEDQVVKEIKELAGQLEFSHTRFWYPGTIGTRDLRNDRLNIKVVKDEFGTYVVDKFYVG
jgi:hypothetical protein